MGVPAGLAFGSFNKMHGQKCGYEMDHPSDTCALPEK